MNKKANLNKKNENNSMSNISVMNKYNTSSRFNVNKKYEKDNTKEMTTTVFKDMNDDYLKSIEMLRKQEEQIKHMLRFIELDDEN